MGRAEDLFKRLSDGGETEIDRLIVDRQSEELFLDFKQSADDGKGNKLHDNDRTNLAKAISGFGNSEGGLSFGALTAETKITEEMLREQNFQSITPNAF